MLAIRSGLFLLFQVVTVIPWSFICILCAPLPLASRYRITMKWVKACIWGAEHICGIRWQVKGLDNLPDGPVLLLSKHQSTWETLFYPAYLDRELSYVFKRELLYLPFFGWGIGLLDMIHIDRSRGQSAFDDVVRQGAERTCAGTLRDHVSGRHAHPAWPGRQIQNRWSTLCPWYRCNHCANCG